MVWKSWAADVLLVAPGLVFVYTQSWKTAHQDSAKTTHILTDSF